MAKHAHNVNHFSRPWFLQQKNSVSEMRFQQFCPNVTRRKIKISQELGWSGLEMAEAGPVTHSFTTFTLQFTKSGLLWFPTL